MATPIGTNVVNSLVRQYIVDEITDVIYSQSPVIFRLIKGNKKMVQGGTQIEIPWMYSRMAAGGSYSGFDVLSIAPSDTVKNGALDWKQKYVPVVFDGLTMIKSDSPDAVANLIKFQFEQANMEMAALLGAAVWSAGTDPKDLDGLATTIDATTNYAGRTRTAGNDTWLQSYVNNTNYQISSAAVGLPALNTAFIGCSKGGYHPTLLCSTSDAWNLYWQSGLGYQHINLTTAGMDDQLYSAGFTNILFNNVPWVIDDYAPKGSGGTTGAVYMLNERFLDLVISPRADFYVEPFQTPVTQDAMVSKMLWAGNLICRNPARQGKLTGTFT